MSSRNFFVVENVDQRTVLASLTCSALLDNVLVEQFRDELLGIISAEAPHHILVDFSPLTRGSTAVINGLLVAKKKMLATGGDLLLCGLQEAMRHNFRILNLEGTVFEIFDDPQLAIAKLSGGDYSS